jgi:hypothetical protein
LHCCWLVKKVLMIMKKKMTIKREKRGTIFLVVELRYKDVVTEPKKTADVPGYILNRGSANFSFKAVNVAADYFELFKLMHGQSIIPFLF